MRRRLSHDGALARARERGALTTFGPVVAFRTSLLGSLSPPSNPTVPALPNIEAVPSAAPGHATPGTPAAKEGRSRPRWPAVPRSMVRGAQLGAGAAFGAWAGDVAVTAATPGHASSTQ